MKLTKKVIELSRQYKTPFLLVNLEQVRKNYRAIKKSIHNVEVYYAIKANSHPRILEVLKDEGCSFEISSLEELKLLRKLSIPSEKIMCFNSIKNEEFLLEMKKLNINIMAYDSKEEVDKIAKFAPKSKLVLRVIVDNEGSEWPLTKKFGVDAAEALSLLKYAREKGLTPYGLTFHVGSQCLNQNNWASALYICDDVWMQAKKQGIDLVTISLGGGIPTQHLKPIPSIQEIGDVINQSIGKKFKNNANDTKITIEPGRGLVGDAAIMVTNVVGKAQRGNENWIFTDVGVFNGLMETIQGFAYEVVTEIERKNKQLVTIAGPSCDSVDIAFKDVFLSEVKVGENLYIINAGAYTTVYAANFNGFPIPETYFL